MSTITSLRRSFLIQRRVLGALLMREVITRYGRHNIGFLWLFMEPMLFTLGVTTLWTVTKATHGSNLSIVAFAVTGYSSVLLWRNGANRCTKAIEPNLSLLYHRNVRVMDVFLSRLILEVVASTISFITLSLLFIALGIMAWPSDIIVMVSAWFLLVWFAISLGLIVGALSEKSETIERLWHTFTYLFFPFSGAVFMVDWMPKSVQEVVLWIPVVHGVEMLRSGFFGESVPTHYSITYLSAVNIALLFIGLILVRETGRRVEPE